MKYCLNKTAKNQLSILLTSVILTIASVGLSICIVITSMAFSRPSIWIEYGELIITIISTITLLLASTIIVKVISWFIQNLEKCKNDEG